MKVLITGGSGLLGKYLTQNKPDNVELALTWNKNLQPEMATGKGVWYKLDVRMHTNVLEMFDLVKPDIVIHTAAIGSVDYAEQFYSETYETNVVGTENILKVAREYKSKIIYISTNAVYSGDSPPYKESDVCNPVNAYGKIKQMAEIRVMDSLHWIIIRPFMLYAWPYLGGRQNWATNILSRIENGLECKMVGDTFWQPTYAYDCAQAIWQLIGQDNEIYNVASPEAMSLYKFALHVCEVFELDKNLVKSVPSSYFPQIAPRPKDTSFDVSKINKLGIKLDNVFSGLVRMKNEKMA